MQDLPGMRFNDKDLCDIAAFSKADKEGRLYYKRLGGKGYKEKWFKLRGNLLFYFRTNEFGAIADTEPSGVIVLERCFAKQEPATNDPYQFSIAFDGEEDKKHFFSCNSEQQCCNWVEVLRASSLEQLRGDLMMLRKRIRVISGNDPLSALLPPLPPVST